MHKRWSRPLVFALALLLVGTWLRYIWIDKIAGIFTVAHGSAYSSRFCRVSNAPYLRHFAMSSQSNYLRRKGRQNRSVVHCGSDR